MTTNRPGGSVYRGVAVRIVLVIMALLSLAACSNAPSRPQLEPAFYPPPPQIPRIQFLTSISSETDLGKKKDAFREFVTGKPEDLRAIGRPWDIDHVRGRLYVSDKSYQQILTIDLEGKQIGFIDNRTGGTLLNPGGIFITDAEYKFIADRKRGEVLVFDQLDQFAGAFGLDDNFQPTDVVVVGDRIYATDVSTDAIRIIDRKSGDLIGSIGGQGEDESAFRFPTHMTVDHDGNLYVTDFLNFRVQQFDPDGNFVRIIGEPGDFPGAMPRPKGIDIDRAGHLYVVDSAFEIVQVFDSDSGNVLLPFGKFGNLSGGTWLPAGVHIDYDNLGYFSQYVDPTFKAEYLIYVTNQAGPFKINVYAFGEHIGSDNGEQ